SRMRNPACSTDLVILGDPFREERDTMLMNRHHRLSPRAIFQGRCSECGAGQIFRGAFRMNERCPVCGYKFERGPGYFTGAMYFSYALEIPIIAAGVILAKLSLVPNWPLHWVLLAVWAAALPIAPAAFRYSRVL